MDHRVDTELKMESTVLISKAKSPHTTKPSRPAGRRLTSSKYTVSGSSSGASAQDSSHRDARDDDDEQP